MLRLLLLAAAGLFSASCSASHPACDLDSEASHRAGAGATDCGHVAVGADRTSANACAVAAFEHQQAFHVEYEEQGTDSRVIRAIVGTSAGAMTFLDYDGDPSGGSGERAVLAATRCNGPKLADASTSAQTGEPFDCATGTSLGRVCE